MNYTSKKNTPPSENELNDLTNLFKVLGDLTRVRILYVLKNKEINVSDICCSLNMTKSAVSHQLSVLRNAKLVKSRKCGKEVYYSLDDEHVSLIFNCALEHVNERQDH